MPKIKRRLILIGGNSVGLIIPSTLREMLGLEKGTLVDLSLVGNQIIIKKSEEKK